MAKLKRIPNRVWNLYHKTLSDFMDQDTAKKKITWKRYREVPSLFGEDRRVEPYDSIEIEVLSAFNTFKTWPHNQSTLTGEWDMKDAVIYLSKVYLKENNWLNEHGYFKFDRARDRFIIDGIPYKTGGDSSIAQGFDSDVLFMIILQREESVTQDIINHDT